MTLAALLVLPALMGCKKEELPDPVVRELGSGWTDVAAGGNFTCALDDAGAVVCWGSDDDGQVSGAPDGDGYLDIVAGGAFACVRDPQGAITCWGRDDEDQTRGSAAALAITAGADHACALEADGQLSCWGDNSLGATLAPNDRFDAVAAGDDFSCAVPRGEGVRCWGLDDGSGPSGDVVEDPPSGDFSELVAGNGFACAWDGTGTAECWGEPDAYVDVPDDNDAWLQISLGLGGDAPEACGIDDAGTAWCAGLADLGASVAGSMEKVAAGGGHGCALSVDGRLACWPLTEDTAAADGPS